MGLVIEKLVVNLKDISGSSFTEVKAEGVHFDNVDLSGIVINNANMSGSDFNDINAENLTMSDANLSGTAITNANMSHMTVRHAHLFGTDFVDIVLPKEGDGNYEPSGNYKPIVFRNCDLSNMEINNCNISGLKIDGQLVDDLLKKA